MGLRSDMLHVEGREGCTVYRSIQKNVSFTRGMGQQLTQTHSSGIREGRAQERGLREGSPLFNPRLRDALHTPHRPGVASYVQIGYFVHLIAESEESWGLNETGSLRNPIVSERKFNLKSASDKEVPKGNRSRVVLLFLLRWRFFVLKVEFER